ncbi:MAG: group 1 truncated hemoglobin [Nannocystaceae bacterium]
MSTDPPNAPRRRASDVPPNPALWDALERGPLLRRILEDFYEQVYADPRLAPFFEHTTKSWAVDHQFAFLAEAFSGQDLYFGDRPRNAHHWMVISDELFDYREALMDATLRRFGLADEHIRHWRAFEEKFRSHIVKDAPFAKKRRGQALPLEGFEAIVLDSGGLCDGCGAVFDKDERAHYHVRTGKVYCRVCKPGPYAGTTESAT